MNPLRLKIELDIPKNELPYLWPSFFNIGSCFAQNQSSKMRRLGFAVSDNPFGILYNPVSIQHLLDRVASDNFYTPNDFYLEEDYFSFEHHGSYHYSSLENAVQKSNDIIKKSKKVFKDSDICLITLGTSLVYEYEGNIVANCHRIPNQKFNHTQLTHSDVLSSLHSIVSACKKIAPSSSVIFSVSPIRHLKSGIVESSRSKSVLIAAIHEFMDDYTNDDISYFPGYEIFMDELRDYRFSKEDLTHPNDQAQHYIWDRFCETYFSKQTLDIIQSVNDFRRLEEHRPQKEDKHAKQVYQMKQKLKNQYPFLTI